MALSSSASKPISNLPRISPWRVRIFGALVALAGAGGFIPFFALPMLRIHSAADWQTVPCKILRSQVVEHKGDKQDTYSIAISYAYDFGAIHYVGTRYDFWTNSSSNYDYRREIVDRLHPGAKTVCYVNPEQPGEAVIGRGFGPDVWLGWIPVLFIAAGMAVVIFARRIAQSTPVVSDLPVGETRSGDSIILKDAQSPLTQFLIIGGIALFWNGLISIKVREAFFQPHPTGLDRFNQLLLIPFILVGIALIVCVFYQLLVLFNPRPQMILSNAALALGESSEVRWSFTGNYSRIRRLTIFVEGREEATYPNPRPTRRGPQTTTETNIFARIRVADLTRQADIGAGRGIFAIPPDTMHSFSAANNKTIWSIILHGEISHWPDVKNQFKLNVAPQALARDPSGKVPP
jgi:hypothetical protein